METKIMQSIEDLTTLINNSVDKDEALKYTQAVLNLMNALILFKSN